MTSQVLTIDETKERLKIGRTAIYNAFRSGQLIKRKVGERTFVSTASVAMFEATLEAHETVKIPDGRGRGVSG